MGGRSHDRLERIDDDHAVSPVRTTTYRKVLTVSRDCDVPDRVYACKRNVTIRILDKVLTNSDRDTGIRHSHFLTEMNIKRSVPPSL